MKRIHLISSPRNISTALMYSFGNRTDCSVVDEPFYANYLSRVDITHPGQAEILNSLPISSKSVISEYILSSFSTDFLFIKNMAHHVDGLDLSFAHHLDNVFLIRNPNQLIASFEKVIANPTMRDIGVKAQWQIYEQLKLINANIVVLDSNELLKDPEAVLRSLCIKLEIPFDNNMLSWKAGPRKEDGVWAKYWYENVHKSTGFSKQRKKDRILPKHLIPLRNEANQYFNLMYDQAIKA